MLIKVLGSAAGGGFPQWNCNAATSRAAWACDPKAAPRTQTSLAVSSDGVAWVLLDASPDIRQQIAATPELQPRPDGPPRNSPIAAVVLTSADVDHVAGLLGLRERQPLTLCATGRVLDVLAADSIFNVLDRAYVSRRALPIGEALWLEHDGAGLGIEIEAFVVPGKIALYRENASEAGTLGTRVGDTIGLEVSEVAGGPSFFYIPCCAAVDATLALRLSGAPLVFFDGTLFRDTELVDQGLSDKTGRHMGHISMSGPDGSIAALARLDVGRRIFVHMNTSNPALIEGSPERGEVERAGWEIAWDGMEVRL